MLLAVAAAGIVVVCQALLSRLSPTQKTDNLPFRKQNYFFSKAERSFYEVLCRSVDANHVVFAKIRLADLVYLPKGTQNRQGYFKRIQAKHVDFVLLDRVSLAPVLAIELDDNSHMRQDRQTRDQFVDKALAVAGLPLLRIPVKDGYVPRQLASLIEEKLAATAINQAETRSPHTSYPNDKHARPDTKSFRYRPGKAHH
jgi:very-short-patch-repair endonuclease